ncbi:MAG: hypothetical protein ACTSR2_14925, partial [Candidatus Hodarchaeales archaeon]
VASFLILIISLSLFGYFHYQLSLLDILSVSQIYVEPKGYEDPVTHEWKGSFWVVLATSSTTDNYLFYKFDKSESEQPYADNKINDKTLIPNATIKVMVTALQPYWQIYLTRKTYNVTKKTYGTWINKVDPFLNGKLTDTYVDPLIVDVWETTGYWVRHVPFQVVVEKIGDYHWKSDPILVDLVGAESLNPITITSPKGEKLIIKLQGQLTTGYDQSPPWRDLIIFSPEYVFEGDELVRAIISYDQDDLSYSNYWFGGGNYYTIKTDLGERVVQRWSDDGSPTHYYISASYPYTPQPVSDYTFPGNDKIDNWWDINHIIVPRKPDVFKDDPNANPYGKSLINYLIGLPEINRIDPNYWKTDRKPEFDFNGRTLKIYLPMRTVSWLYTLWISTELADTAVYQPLAANGKITYIKWLSSDTGYAEIGGKDVALVTIKQLSSERSGILVQASATTSLAKITPEDGHYAILDPNEEKTFSFTVENLGVSTEVTGELSFRVYNDLGSQTDSSKLTFKLLPIGIGNTILTVYTVDAKTKIKVSGIFVSIAYGAETDTKATVNGMATFNLGSYQGTVQISIAETEKYKSASTSIRVQSGQNTAYIELLEKVSPEPPWYIKYWWVMVIAISMVVTILVTMVFLKK